MIHPVESTRPSPELIWVRFSDDSSAEIACPAALIGNPIARYIDGWNVYRGERPWRLLDAGEHDADLLELLAAMPEDDRYLSIEPGWYPLVAQAWRQFKQIDPDCVVAEVKEKFGELRVSTVLTDDRARSTRHGLAIGWARKQSLRACEWCAGAVETDAAQPGRPSRLCAPCRTFHEAWNAAWSEVARR
jgi:hypothetical protein